LLRALSEARLGTCGGGRVGVVERTVADERKIAAAQELVLFDIALCSLPSPLFALRVPVAGIHRGVPTTFRDTALGERGA